MRLDVYYFCVIYRHYECGQPRLDGRKLAMLESHDIAREIWLGHAHFIIKMFRKRPHGRSSPNDIIGAGVTKAKVIGTSRKHGGTCLLIFDNSVHSVFVRLLFT
mmetsp:Transcript_20209/g.40267  ORF Transcript_20209/g.40267 Transcript_20209/m.40267 type:complete len:104 (-) Transcript_20209:116-427(-)